LRDYSTGRTASRCAAGLLALALVAPWPAPAAAAAADAAREMTALGPLAYRSGSSEPVMLNIDPPLIRVGLTTDSNVVELSASGGFHLVDELTGRDLWKRKHLGLIRVVLQFKSGPPSSRFRVQVASLSDEGRAKELRGRIERETGEVAVVTYDSDRRLYRVRVGAASTRDGVRAAEEKLRAMGFAETWIVEESVGGGRGMKLRLVDEDYEDLVIESRHILAVPATSDGPIQVDGKPYRGAVEVLVAGGARLRAVNVLNMEDYLRGVVPLELGPSVYPEIEALKAQAVAARTYAYANRGQFSSEGFDLCDTPRCQVYGGLKGESDMSDTAVAETRGLILTSGGEPVNALYTATCGGHTEDVKNVFRQEELPYLKGVPCYAEAAVLEAWRKTLVGTPPPPDFSDPSGTALGEASALLAILGVVYPVRMTPESMAEIAGHREIEDAVGRALTLAGKKPPNVSLPSGSYPSVAGLARYLITALGWEEDVGLLLDDQDLSSILGGGLFPLGVTEGRAEAAYLIQQGILPPRLGPRDDYLAPVTRPLLYRVLFRILLRYDALGLRKAIYRGAREDTLILVPEEKELAGLAASIEVRTSAGLVLSREDDEGAVLVGQITLMPGDKITYLKGDDGRVSFIRLKANTKGASDDRFTPVYNWTVRYTRDELEQKISQRANIGSLVDITPTERGVSGRVSALSVTGSRGKFTFRGFGIRSLLGLRENLFVVDRQRGRGGRVESFIFTGKGWGHGVGLCQVGAYGMALRGSRYDEILKHYYTGVEIVPLPPEQ